MAGFVSTLLAQIKEADAKRGLYMQEVFWGKVPMKDKGERNKSGKKLLSGLNAGLTV